MSRIIRNFGLLVMSVIFLMAGTPAYADGLSIELERRLPRQLDAASSLRLEVVSVQCESSGSAFGRKCQVAGNLHIPQQPGKVNHFSGVLPVVNIGITTQYYPDRIDWQFETDQLGPSNLPVAPGGWFAGNLWNLPITYTLKSILLKTGTIGLTVIGLHIPQGEFLPNVGCTTPGGQYIALSRSFDLQLDRDGYANISHAPSFILMPPRTGDFVVRSEGNAYRPATLFKLDLNPQRILLMMGLETKRLPPRSTTLDGATPLASFAKSFILGSAGAPLVFEYKLSGHDLQLGDVNNHPTEDIIVLEALPFDAPWTILGVRMTSGGVVFDKSGFEVLDLRRAGTRAPVDARCRALGFTFVLGLTTTLRNPLMTYGPTEYAWFHLRPSGPGIRTDELANKIRTFCAPVWVTLTGNAQQEEVYMQTSASIKFFLDDTYPAIGRRCSIAKKPADSAACNPDTPCSAPECISYMLWEGHKKTLSYTGFEFFLMYTEPYYKPKVSFHCLTPGDGVHCPARLQALNWDAVFNGLDVRPYVEQFEQGR